MSLDLCARSNSRHLTLLGCGKAAWTTCGKNRTYFKSTHKGVNSRCKYVTQVQQQRPESPTVTLTWHACKYKVHKLHMRYILKMLWTVFRGASCLSSLSHPRIFVLCVCSMNCVLWRILSFFTVFKAYKNLAPPYLKQLFIYSNTRATSRFITLPKPRIDLFKTSFSFSGASLWNAIPTQIKSCNSLTSFKTQLYKWFTSRSL